MGTAAPPTHASLPELSHPVLTHACGVATDAQGNLFVSEFSSAPVKRISVYPPDGSSVPLTSFTTEGVVPNNPCRIAVDSSDRIYVINSLRKVVIRYAPSSTPVTSSTTYSVDTSLNGTGTLVSGSNNTIFDVAVDPTTQNVYVARADHIESYQPDGTLISSTIGSFVSGAKFIGVDVYGKNGNVYVTDEANEKAYVFNPIGDTILAEWNGSDSPAGVFEFAELGSDVVVDQSNGHAYISEIREHHAVVEFDGAGSFVSLISHSPPFEHAAPSTVTVDNGASSPNKGTVYLTAYLEGAGKEVTEAGVFAFGPLIYAFPLKLNFGGEGGGTVISAPSGIECGKTCKGEFEAEGTVKLKAEPGIGSAFGEWSGCDSVDLEGKCVVKMTGAREVGVRFDSRPLISEETASQVTNSSAQLEAKANPKGKATTYYFEYVSEEAWEAEGFASATKVPLSAVSIGSGGAAVPVAIKVEGLEPSTAYRFRVVATNAIGTAEGERNSSDVEIERSFTTYSPPDVFPPCANDSFRTGLSASLPDCRAYEQASPVDKNGASVQAMAGATRTPEDGSAITFEATSGIPGGAGAQNFPTYMARRSASGWSTTGLLPTPASGQIAAVLGWSADFTTAFDRAQILGQGTSMLARSTSDGTQTEIVPHTTPNPSYGYVDSSADGGTTIFESRPETLPDTTQQLTPDAAPGKPNVYAWSREAEELRLVGIFPDGTTPSQGSRVGRGMDADEYNRDLGAVTEEGDAFFNVNDTEGQLYLRLNSIADETGNTDSKGSCIPDPVLACTVHVSASQKTDGKGPNGHDAAGPQPAYLRAASPDGKVITFTSSEKLTNDANTGIEPEAPAIARAKASDGGEKNLGFIPAFAHDIAVDETEGYVYWSDPAHGRIGRAKLDGTGKNESYVTVGGTPWGIAVIDEGSAKYIFWTDRGALNEAGEPQEGMGTIGRVGLDGTGANPTCYSGLSYPRSIAADASYIYWTMPRLDPAGQNIIGIGDVGRAEVTCNPGSVNPTFVAERLATGDIAVNSTYIYVSRFIPGFSESYILRYALDDGTEHEFLHLVSDTKVPAEIALDGTHLYWSDREHNQIGRSNLDGSNPEENFIADAGQPEALARGGGDLLWTTHQELLPNQGTDLYQLDRESGELTDLAPDSTDTNGIEVLGALGASADGSYVYFAANGVPDALSNSVNGAGESPQLGNCKNGNPSLQVPAKGSCNLYLAHGGEVEFIARLDAKAPGGEKDTGDGVDWVLGHSDIENRELGKSARVGAGGRVLVFRSSRQLTNYDNQGPRCVNGVALQRAPGPCLEFYRFEYGQPGLTCLTCSPRGAVAEGPARMGSLGAPGFIPPQPAATLARNLSRDGDRFFFETEDALNAADTNGQDSCPPWGSGKQKAFVRACQDVYEWEAPDSGSCKEDSPAYSVSNGGCIYLLSTGKSKEASFFADADAEGNNAFVFTYEQLVPQDRDGLFDVYDVRAGGGLASQHEEESTPCEGEGCKAQPVPSPAAQLPGSAGFSGSGDQAPKRTAKHHKRKRKHHRHRQKRRAANQSGRAGR